MASMWLPPVPQKEEEVTQKDLKKEEVARAFEAWKEAPGTIVSKLPDGTEVAYKKQPLSYELSDEDEGRLARYLRKIHRIFEKGGVDGGVEITISMRRMDAHVCAKSWVGPDVTTKVNF